MNMEDFRNSLLKYLLLEKSLEEEEEEKRKRMTREEKVQNNLLLVDVTIRSHKEDVYELVVPDNYSKMRAGDRIILTQDASDSVYEATILDVYFDIVTISCNRQLPLEASYSIEQKSPLLLQSLISCLDGIYDGIPGAAFLRLLAGEDEFESPDFMKVDIRDVPGFEGIRKMLNEEQLSAVASMMEYPPVHVLQGPPGTGKTAVLAATAIASAHLNREVVIIANTHHAVNVALSKIRSLDSKATLIKVGTVLKAEELDGSILTFERFNDYYEYSYKNRKKKRYGHIIGMTIWGAVSYLGLRHHAHFRPYHALIDEASLMPLSLASILGKTAPSICLFGDSRQMPPIFHKELESKDESISILDFCQQKVVGVPVKVLHSTYRMNEDITKVVSSSFYEPFGIKLISRVSAKDSGLHLNCIEDFPAVEFRTIEDALSEESNIKEAREIASLITDLQDEGLSSSDMAVITPFRKQVKTIREVVKEETGVSDILIDTVERLQGQDVEIIILSFATSSPIYIEKMKAFLFNPNRLNVMLSRAKKKVIIFSSYVVAQELKSILKID